MKRLFVGLLLVLALIVPGGAADLTSSDEQALRQALERSAADFFKGDYEHIVAQMPGPLIRDIGGHAKAVALITQAADTLNREGVRFVAYRNEAAEGPIRAGDYVLYVVREHLTLEDRAGRFVSHEFSLGVRLAAGGPWKLVRGTGVENHPGLMPRLYPGFPRDYPFPKLYSEPVAPQDGRAGESKR